MALCHPSVPLTLYWDVPLLIRVLSTCSFNTCSCIVGYWLHCSRVIIKDIHNNHVSCPVPLSNTGYNTLFSSTVQCTSFSTSSVLQYPWPYYICYQFILTVSLHFLQYLYYKSLYPVPTMYCISSTTSPYILYLLCISSTTSPYIQYLQLNSITSSFSCSTCKSACTVKGCVLCSGVQYL